VEIDWVKKGNKMHKHWENTILGHMKISDRSLIVDVNSANRATRIAAEIEKRLGMMAVHLATHVKTQKELMEEAKAKKAVGADRGKGEDPELAEMSRALMQEEIEAWVHRRIPILGGHSPMEAMNDPDGREIVESLLADWERLDGPVHPDLTTVRRLLNLPAAK